MGDNDANSKKRKTKYITSYSAMSQALVEQRLGFAELKGIPVERVMDFDKYIQA